MFRRCRIQVGRTWSYDKCASLLGGQQSKPITLVTYPTHIGCASCNFTSPAGVMPGDGDFCSLRKVATIASVDGTRLTLCLPVPA